SSVPGDCQGFGVTAAERATVPLLSLSGRATAVRPDALVVGMPGGTGPVGAGEGRFAYSDVALRCGGSASGSSECRQLPSKNAPVSTANASCRMFPSTWQVEHRRTLRARIPPSMRPLTVKSSAQTSPWINALSPTTRPAPRTSPSTRPSIWISPTEVSEPLTTRSALIIDGVDVGRIGRFCCCAKVGCDGVGAAGADSLLLLENMSSGLDEVARIARHVFVGDLIVDMRSRAA